MKPANITMGLILLTTLFSPYCAAAINHSSSAVAAQPGPMRVSAGAYHDNNNFPEFSIEEFQVLQNTTGREAEITFTLKSTGLLYYHVYLNDKDNFDIIETSGFVNNNQRHVSLKKSSTMAGNYKVIIELIDNNKVTVTRNYDITLD
ncbi:hypothetical protein [Yersinia sp. Marseille-Q3913]|uniref:hypothetical protein n=1 Tax=Yersinia sp. Marseille-Q3913 TaxID=2830769 RepID=UPI001BB09CAB|nr:hypothetical protein [Yersinia sp. Marseille-Q3913]MBS0057162.1 hypothetical protein [Yersinia sp. Marseille-Q3913]